MCHSAVAWGQSENNDRLPLHTATTMALQDILVGRFLLNTVLKHDTSRGADSKPNISNSSTILIYHGLFLTYCRCCYSNSHRTIRKIGRVREAVLLFRETYSTTDPRSRIDVVS